MKICDKCGVANPDNAAFCTGCGAVLLNNTDVKEEMPENTVNQTEQGSPEQQADFAQQNTAYTQYQQSPFVQPVYSQPAQPQMPYSPQYGYINENMLPPEYKPVSVGQYVGYTILFGLPIIGLIMLLVTAFGSDNSVGLRNFAKSVLVFYAIGIVLTIVMFIFSMLLAASMY